MYKLENNVAWTDELKNAFKHGITKGKIVFDNTEINYDNGLKDIEINDSRYVPKLGFIGQATSRKATINLLDKLQNINLENKEIEIFIGADYNNQTYYINYGKFIVNAPPQNDSTNGTIKVVAYDYMIKFNKEYVDAMIYPCTLKQLLQSLCTQAGVELGSQTFANDTFSVIDNQFEGKTLREVLQNIAKCAFSWARIGQDNKLYLDFENKRPILPEEYQEVEYIEATGTQYIKTNIFTDVVNNNSAKIESEVKWNSNSGSQYFGANLGNFVGIKNGVYNCQGYTTEIEASTNDFQKISSDIVYSTKEVNGYVDNNTFSGIRSSNVNSSRICIFTITGQGDVVSTNNLCNCKMKYFRFYYDDVLAYNFIPCYRKSDNVIGMYDLINGIFYVNEGTGTFNKGNNVNYYDEVITTNDYMQDSYKRANEYYGAVNRVTYADTNITGQEESVEDSEDVELHGVKELAIYDNLFAYTTEKRYELIQAGTRLLGLKYMPIQDLKCVGLIYLDCNDIIEVYDGEENYITSRTLSHIIRYNGATNDNIQTEASSNNEQTYKNINSPILQNSRTEIMVDRANKRITSITQEIGDRSEKTTTITQDIDGIQSAVEDIEDLTNTVSGLKTVSITDAYPDNDILELHIYGNNSVFDYLYPDDELYPDDSLLPYGDSKIRFYNSKEDRTINLGIMDVLRQNTEVRDEVVIDYQGNVSLIRRVNKNGTTKPMPEVTELGQLHFTLVEGTNTFEIVNYIAPIEVKYVMKSTLTDVFTTKVETRSEIKQTADAINLEVSKKVGENEVISKINMSPEGIQIQADKISLAGKTIDLTGSRINITSDNFSVDQYGNLTANRATLRGVISNYDSNTGYLAVKIDNSIIGLYDYKNNGIAAGGICSTYTQSWQRSGIALYAKTGKRFTIGYQDDNNTTIHSLFGYDEVNENAFPFIKNTASGTIFPWLSGGGIQVQNGLIKNWNMAGTWSGTYNVQVGSSIYLVSVQNGLMTNIEQVS